MHVSLCIHISTEAESHPYADGGVCVLLICRDMETLTQTLKHGDSFIGRCTCFKHVPTGIFMFMESQAYTHRGIAVVKTHIHKHVYACTCHIGAYAYHDNK